MKKATTKAISALVLAVFMAALLFGTWLIMPADVQAATNETNATGSNVTVKAYVSCGMPTNWSDGIEFGSLDPGASNQRPSPDSNYTMVAPSTNNVGIDFHIMANAPLTSGTQTILLSNYTWNMTKFSDVPKPAGSPYGTALTTDYVEGTLCDNTLNGSNCTAYFWLDINMSTPAGTYNNTITMKCNQTD